MDTIILLISGTIITCLLLLCSAFFSSSETAVFALPSDWVAQQATTDDPRAKALKKLHGDPHRLLVTLLVGNNIVNIAISSIITMLVIGYLPASVSVVVATILTSVIILLFGEIVPKAYGLANAQTWSLTIANPVRFVAWALSPLISIFDGITRRMSAFITVDTAIERPYSD
ncbi:CNNM domain-containing protein [Natronocalculus amylovorans]|uniref:DUF21 domain-containing protein n=1 Tax=Natronocalculus amylovorans TaxID=2917812 RepID=A0AAE3FYC7_9EURY|nr:DUF21 domain-containing protein [Natronocalculus amylovorans]MCL9817569.1 DUF21 domain-containing protein [Natronocalculus amylovorans]